MPISKLYLAFLSINLIEGTEKSLFICTVTRGRKGSLPSLTRVLSFLVRVGVI